MNDVLQYGGKRVVVTGCSSGMGEAAATILADLGADVVGLDVKPPERDVATFVEVDLRDGESIDAAADAIGSPVDSIFSIAGLPGPPFTDLETVLVNFVGARHLVESLLPAMSSGGSILCVASNAGLGWQQELHTLLPAVQVDGFEEAKAYLEERPELIEGGYLPSKKLMNTWVAWRGVSLIADGIRLNCSNPGPTDTAMMPAFEALAGKEMIDAFVGPSGRRSNAEEQAWAMVLINSPRAAYIAGEALHVDGGFLAAMTTGQL